MLEEPSNKVMPAKVLSLNKQERQPGTEKTGLSQETLNYCCNVIDNVL